MAGSKRERELARAKYERQAARRAAAAARRRRRNQVVAVVAVLVVVVGAVVWFALGRGSDDQVANPAISPLPSGSAQPSASAQPSGQPSGSPTPSGSGSTSARAIDCAPAPSPKASAPSWSAPPKDTLDPGAAYKLTLKTTCGDIVIATQPAKAPKTVNSMLFLSEQGYFDDTPCHRLVTEGIFVLQCGDPTGKGTEGPGYTVPDENLPAAGDGNYPTGTVAMANAGPGTAGSQFFIVYNTTTLPPNYTIWGTVTKGLDIVQAVAAAGVQGGGADGPPAQPISITATSVTAS